VRADAALRFSVRTARHCGELVGGTHGQSRVLRIAGWGTPEYCCGAARVQACAAAAAARGAARAVLSCAGAYMVGFAGSNACPAGSVRIETEAACRTAAAATGKTASTSFVVTSSLAPSGCAFNPNTNQAQFNTFSGPGEGSSTRQVLCVAAGAPPRAYSHACTPACAAALRACIDACVSHWHKRGCVAEVQRCTFVDCAARQRRWGGAVRAQAVRACAPNRPRVLEGTAQFSWAARVYNKKANRYI
jgi:hypothetical protein